jgi:hypothetical protein
MEDHADLGLRELCRLEVELYQMRLPAELETEFGIDAYLYAGPRVESLAANTRE